MNKTNIAIKLLIGLAIFGLGFASVRMPGRDKSTPMGIEARINSLKPPQDLAHAKKTLQETSQLLEKDLLPLLEHIPQEVKRTRDLLRMNERMLEQLANLEALKTN